MKARGVVGTIKAKMPKKGITKFEDIVYGEHDLKTKSFANSELQDPVLIKKDGNPSAFFKSTIDDLTQKVSHVIRSEVSCLQNSKQLSRCRNSLL